MPAEKNLPILTKKASTTLNIFSSLLFLGLVLLVVSHETMLFKSMPMNGAFQLYNPLERLAAGEVIGRDFDFFHGAGTLLIHYPIYALCGGDLHASEISRKLMSPLAFFLCFQMCAAAWRLPAYFAPLAACAALVIGEAILHGSTAMDGASILGVRSCMPVIALPIAILLARRFEAFAKPLLFHLTLAVCLGIGIFISTEQGLAALGVFGLLILAVPIKFRNPLARIATGAATGVVAISVFVGITLLISGSHALDSLNFLLADLPKEQFWYFGAPPNVIPEFPGLLLNPLVILGVWTPLFLMGLELLRLGRGKEVTMDSVLVIALLGMAMVVQIPQLASYSHYQSVATRNMGLVAMLGVFRMMQWPVVAGHPMVAKIVSRKMMLPAMACAGMTAAAAFTLMAFRLAAKRERESGGSRYNGMVLSKGWTSDLAVWDELAAKDTKVAGTYRAMVEDKQGSTFKGPDYIIHALGSRRERFMENLVAYDPDFFLTLTPDFSLYEEWLQLRHWNVYQLLLERYTPLKASEHHVFWKKKSDRNQPLSNPAAVATVAEGSFWVSPPNDALPCIYTVRVRYSVTNPLVAIPVFGKLPRYLLTRETLQGSSVTTGIPASLPPGEESWEFPIVLGQGEQARFGIDTPMALPGSKIEIISIDMTETSRDPQAIEALTHGGKLQGAISQ